MMEFRIANTFTDSLAKLSGEDQKATKTAVFDLQMNPANPGLKLHKLDRAKDKRFWSVRAGSDIRLIVHRSDQSLLLCYAGHHDNAYDWANRRKIERHPKTGAAQIVEVRETVREIEIPKYVKTPAEAKPVEAQPLPLLFKDRSRDELLAYGVPEEWLDDVLKADEESLLRLADHLPDEAAEALLELATGATPELPSVASDDADPFEHPDAQRRFRVMSNMDELQAALDYPWEKWITFLHPEQRDMVTRDFNGPARVAGSAGTGKTIVALHRAVHLATANPESNVLLTTFSIALAKALRHKLNRLVGEQASLSDRITVRSIDEVGIEAYEADLGTPSIPTPAMLRTLLKSASNQAPEHKFSLHFLETEWNDVVDAWQLDSWEAYRDVPRLGRKTRLGEKQRAILWAIFEQVRHELEERGLITMPGVFQAITKQIKSGSTGPAEFVLVDEAQDISVPQLRFLAATVGETPNGLFFAGDLGQRIFQTPFSWKTLGVDIRGRSKTLRINYRTSHQIRRQADRLLPPELSDVDGNEESRAGIISVFNGDDPAIERCDTKADEKQTIEAWLNARKKEGVEPHEMGVFVRSDDQMSRAIGAITAAGFECQHLDADNYTVSGKISAATMHLAKGLEFKAVVVAACDDEVIPLQERIEAIADEADLAHVYETERHLLYVACTRARDHLLITCVDPGSEFLDDMTM